MICPPGTISFVAKVGDKLIDGSTKAKLEALDDAELSAMFEEMAQAHETMMAEGLSQEEMMMAGMELYMGVLIHIMTKTAEALGVEQ